MHNVHSTVLMYMFEERITLLAKVPLLIKHILANTRPFRTCADGTIIRPCSRYIEQGELIQI